MVHIPEKLQYFQKFEKYNIVTSDNFFCLTNVDSYTIFDHQTHNRIVLVFSSSIKNIIDPGALHTQFLAQIILIS